MSDVLRLAVDARDLPSDTRGIGRYARAILRRIVQRPEFDLTLLAYGPFPGRHRSRMRAAIASDRFRMASHARGCAVTWHPGNGTFFAGAGASVVTIHDAVPFRFPLEDEKRREHQQAPFRRSVQSASRFVAVSEFDRRELQDVFGIPADRIDVIYHGVDPEFAPGSALAHVAPELRSQPYLLFVGDTSGVEPRKNFPLLYEAYRRAFPDGTGPRLVVVGPTDPHVPDVHYAGVAAGDAQGSGDAFLRDHYCGALALCVPSFHETFGMPMVEAMACGTPVVASEASCLPEVAGDAALFAQPHDAQSWAAALARIVESSALRADLREKGLARARRYDWDESAQRHAGVFISVARESTTRAN